MQPDAACQQWGGLFLRQTRRHLERRSPVPHYDAIVLGVGGMGSAALYHLARRGLRVLGLERYNIPNDMGSSHGLTRIIRLAYYEHPSYVPLLRRAYELWRQLENTVEERLLVITGSIDASAEGDHIIEGSRASCEIHHLPHEVLDSRELNKRFPGYRLPEGILALYQPDGGFLLPERCIVAHVIAAQEMGAEVHGREPVVDWEPAGRGVQVRTDRGHYSADKLVICAGAWGPKLMSELSKLAVPERQVLAWFQPIRPDLFRLHTFPVFNIAVEEGRFYGFPAYGIPGFKVGRYHHLSQRVDPDAMDREVHREDEDVLRGFTARYFPDAAGPTMSLMTCIFTNTPDEHFILDLHPRLPQVCIAAGFSGHGFKFCSVVGEIMADLAQDGRSRYDLDLFSLRRFTETPSLPPA
ncbi:MAG: N-methyl-L-tryptophan oxidase [Nitrospinae bacterium]|nr:N-methyl-L-tryptophan oxidase [Nitrospinota bacterium]